MTIRLEQTPGKMNGVSLSRKPIGRKAVGSSAADTPAQKPAAPAPINATFTAMPLPTSPTQSVMLTGNGHVPYPYPTQPGIPAGPPNPVYQAPANPGQPLQQLQYRPPPAMIPPQPSTTAAPGQFQHPFPGPVPPMVPTSAHHQAPSPVPPTPGVPYHSPFPTPLQPVISQQVQPAALQFPALQHPLLPSASAVTLAPHQMQPTTSPGTVVNPQVSPPTSGAPMVPYQLQPASSPVPIVPPQVLSSGSGAPVAPHQVPAMGMTVPVVVPRQTPSHAATVAARPYPQATNSATAHPLPTGFSGPLATPTNAAPMQYSASTAALHPTSTQPGVPQTPVSLAQAPPTQPLALTALTAQYSPLQRTASVSTAKTIASHVKQASPLAATKNSPTPPAHASLPRRAPGQAPAPGQLRRTITTGSTATVSSTDSRRMSTASTPTPSTPLSPIAMPEAPSLDSATLVISKDDATVCTSCVQAIASNVSIFTCLVCATVNLKTAFCVWCFTTGAAASSHPHSSAFFATDSDLRIQGPTGNIPTDIWIVRKNAAGRLWYTHVPTGFKTHLQPLTVTPDTTATGLPLGWQELKTPDGRLYYSHPASGVTSWTKPQNPLPAGWKMIRTPDNVPFYVHEEYQITTWDRPGESPRPEPVEPPAKKKQSAAAGLAAPGKTQMTAQGVAGPIVKPGKKPKTTSSITASDIRTAASVATNVAKLSAASDMSPSGILTATVAAAKLTGLGMKIAGKKMGRMGRGKRLSTATNLIGAAARFAGDDEVGDCDEECEFDGEEEDDEACEDIYEETEVVGSGYQEPAYEECPPQQAQEPYHGGQPATEQQLYSCYQPTGYAPDPSMTTVQPPDPYGAPQEPPYISQQAHYYPDQANSQDPVVVNNINVTVEDNDVIVQNNALLENNLVINNSQAIENNYFIDNSQCTAYDPVTENNQIADSSQFNNNQIADNGPVTNVQYIDHHQIAESNQTAEVNQSAETNYYILHEQQQPWGQTHVPAPPPEPIPPAPPQPIDSSWQQVPEPPPPPAPDAVDWQCIQSPPPPQIVEPPLPPPNVVDHQIVTQPPLPLDVIDPQNGDPPPPPPPDMIDSSHQIVELPPASDVINSENVTPPLPPPDVVDPCHEIVDPPPPPPPCVTDSQIIEPPPPPPPNAIDPCYQIVEPPHPCQPDGQQTAIPPPQPPLDVISPPPDIACPPPDPSLSPPDCTPPLDTVPAAADVCCPPAGVAGPPESAPPPPEAVSPPAATDCPPSDVACPAAELIPVTGCDRRGPR